MLHHKCHTASHHITLPNPHMYPLVFNPLRQATTYVVVCGYQVVSRLAPCCVLDSGSATQGLASQVALQWHRKSSSFNMPIPEGELAYQQGLATLTCWHPKQPKYCILFQNRK